MQTFMKWQLKADVIRANKVSILIMGFILIQ